MKVLILGAGGMLGHKLCQIYRNQFDIWATVRSNASSYVQYDLLDPIRLLGGVDALNFDTIIRALADVRPDVVINCIGIVKQLPTAKDPIISISVNSVFPHRLAILCKAVGARLIHISTDCIFSGRRGMYTENDVSDGEDLYGRTKFLGEVGNTGCLTIRTSIIGRELRTTSGLVEWFLSERGNKVRGFTKAVYSGFTTLTMARVISQIINNNPMLSGVYQVSSEPISKYDLLCLLREAYNLRIEIEPYSEIQIDRSLDGKQFQSMTCFKAPSWSEMISEMASDPTPYEEWRTTHEKQAKV